METLVLCPEELCLGASTHRPHHPPSFAMSPPCDFSVWTNSELDKGTKFLPWKGSVRSDKLPVFDKLPEFDIRNRFGLYDEISEVAIGRRIRQCNWIRFLRYTIVYNEDVNVIGFKGPTGEPIFELIKDIGPKTELIAFFVPEQPQEAFLLPAIQYLRHTLFKRLIDNVLEESPLDLSNSLVSNLKPPPEEPDAAERRSVSGESTASMDSEAVVSATSPALIPDASVASTIPPPLLNFHRNLFPTSVLHRSLSSMASEAAKPFSAEMVKPSPPPSVEIKKNDTNNNDEASSSPVHHSPIHTNSSLTFPAPKSTAATSTTRRREKNMLPCNYCGKAFDRPSLLKRHIRIHTGERPHVCDYCNKGFSTSSSLNTHRRIHSGEKPHQCGVCGKRFTASSNLYYHRMTHVKEKPHKCTMCSKSFPTPGDLKSHMYVHTGTWPFKCHICQRGFSKQTNLKNHLLLHSGDKPFSCEICHKKFALSCNLRSHIKTHESEFQSSAASIALYQRALAMLGSPGGAGGATESGGEEAKSEPGSPKQTLFGNQVTIKV